MKLSKAQMRALATVPDEWGPEPLRGDGRSVGPLLWAGMIEQRSIDAMPSDWPTAIVGVKIVRPEWRRTPAGRAALATKETAPHVQ